MLKNLKKLLVTTLIVMQVISAASPAISVFAVRTATTEVTVSKYAATTKTALKIIKQPKSVKKPSGKTAKVTVTVKGKGLKYYWYFKNKGAKKYTRATSFKGNSYSVKMNKDRNGRMVYCVIKDKNGKSVKTKAVTLKLGKTLKITKQPKSTTVHSGSTATVKISVSGDKLKYNWYFKNKGAKKYTRATSFKSNSYSVKMNKDRNGRMVYCVIKDKYGKSVKTKTATLKLGKTLKITKQPKSTTVHSGSTATVKISVSGDKLKYNWYFKDSSQKKYTLTKAFTGNTYSVKMNSARNGRQIYCKITDAYGKVVKTKTVKLSTGHTLGSWATYIAATTESNGIKRAYCKKCGYYKDRTVQKLTAVYYITANTGSSTYKIGVPKSGKYSIKPPKREGYNFEGWVDTNGKPFAASGIITKNITIKAKWSLDGTDTLKGLIARTEAGVGEINITADIVIDTPIYISHKTKIYANSDYSLIRDPNYSGDMLVVGIQKNGDSAIWFGREAKLTLGGGKGCLSIDGNRDNLKVTVNGSAVFLAESAELNLYDGVRIANNKKIGNERTLDFISGASQYASQRAGGAAIVNINSTVNMYGGLIENNLVATEYTTELDEQGVAQQLEYNGCGGAVYNRGNFNMYGGVVTTSEGLRGGAFFNDRMAYLYAGEISHNTASVYGGAIASSSSMNSDLFIGNEDGNGKFIIKGNRSLRAGGALYSNTSSPIIIYGNTEFLNNRSETSGGAIYTAGALTISDAVFDGNNCVYSGGSIYHHYTKAEFNRREINVSNTEFKNGSSNLGGAIVLSTSGTASTENEEGTLAYFSNCVFTGNTALTIETGDGNGGALYITRKCDATITDCTFSGNTADKNAGAVAIHSESVVDIKDTEFIGNKAAFGGATYISSGAKVDLTNIKYENNCAKTNPLIDGSGNGGALCIAEVKVTFNNVDFSGNEADNNAGALYQNYCTTEIDSTCEFTGNKALGHGGAIYLTYKKIDENTKLGAVLNANNVVFKDNTALSGGAISARTNSTVNLKGVEFVGNTTPDAKVGEDQGGGAIYTNNSALDIEEVDFNNNASGYYGGSIKASECNIDITNTNFTGSSGGTGAAMYASSCKVTANNISVKESTSTFNGFFYLTKSNVSFEKLTATDNNGKYGVVYAAGGSIVALNNSNFVGSNVSVGGALYAADSAVVDLNNTELKNNTATSSGGAIYAKNKAKVNINAAEIKNNKAANGGAVFIDGAVLRTIQGVLIEGNAATGYGGAVYVAKYSKTENEVTTTAEADVLVSNASFIGNTALRGGAIYATNSSYSVENSEFKQNTATEETLGYGGGAIYSTAGKGTISGVNFTENRSVKGGAVALHSESELNVTSVTATKNEAYANSQSKFGIGGVIYAINSTLNLNGTESSIKFGGVEAGNKAASDGGAIYAEKGSTLNIAGTEFVENSSNLGGGIYVKQSTINSMSNNKFKANSSATNGGAICIVGDTVTATGNNVFEDNTAVGHAGAIYVTYVTVDNVKVGGVLNMTDGTFKNNTAMGGGAVSIRTNSEATFENTVFTKNSVEGCNKDNEGNDDPDGDGEGGGAIYVGFGKLNLTNVTATENEAAVFGGVVDGVSATINVVGGSYSNNQAADGGVFYNISSTKLNIEGAEFKNNESTFDNSATWNGKIGGGAINMFKGELSVKSSVFDGNVTNYYGGAILTEGTKVTISENSKFKNSVGKTGAAIGIKNASSGSTIKDTKVTNTNGSGNGALYITGGTASIKNLTASENTSSNGGAMYISTGANVTIENSTFTKNKATNGGFAYSTRANTSIVNCVIEENTATSSGGAIYAAKTDAETSSSKFTVSENTKFKNNTAKNGGAVYLDKGAEFTVTNSEFDGNRATGNGGAIVIADATQDDELNTTLTANDVTFKNNTAVGKGGAISTWIDCPNIVINVEDCTFNKNSSTGAGGGAVEIQNKNQPDATDPEKVNIVFTNCEFTENSAEKAGGAIEIRNSSCAKIDGITANGNNAKETGGVVYVTSKYSRLYLTGTVTASNNTASSGNFAYLYNSSYDVAPKIYTTHSKTEAWVSDVKGNSSNIDFGLTELP